MKKKFQAETLAETQTLSTVWKAERSFKDQSGQSSRVRRELRGYLQSSLSFTWGKKKMSGFQVKNGELN